MELLPRPLALFDDRSHFFKLKSKRLKGNSEKNQTNPQGDMMSPAFHLRGGGKRADNTRFWGAVQDIYCDPDRGAASVIHQREIIDPRQQDELRYCGALVSLRQGALFDKATELHGVGDGSIKDILRSESVALNALKKGSRVFRDAFQAVYSPDSVSDVIKLSAITSEVQKASLREHACMFYIRRGMLAHELTEHFYSPEAGRSIFREACRQEIEEGKSAPEAITHQRMKNEDDKALIRLIGAAEDIQEGMSVEAAGRRNEVPQEDVELLDQFERELYGWRHPNNVLDGLSEDYLHALETTEVYGGSLRGVKRKRAPQEKDAAPPAKRRHIKLPLYEADSDQSSRNPPADATGSGQAIRRLKSHETNSLPVDLVLNGKDELVPERTLSLAGIKRSRDLAFGEQPSSMQNETSNPIDTSEADTTSPRGAPPAKRMRELDERQRSRASVLG